MAHSSTWEKLRYFKPDSRIDRFGDPGAIADDLLLRLDDFRHWLGVPVYVLHGVKTQGHSPTSYHYVENGACAVDVVVPDYKDSGINLVLDATRFGFTGIGYYPHWKWNGVKCGGLHLDTRPLKWDSDETLNYNHARWMGVMKDGVQIYIPLEADNIMAYEDGGDLFLD